MAYSSTYNPYYQEKTKGPMFGSGMGVSRAPTIPSSSGNTGMRNSSIGGTTMAAPKVQTMGDQMREGASMIGNANTVKQGLFGGGKIGGDNGLLGSVTQGVKDIGNMGPGDSALDMVRGTWGNGMQNGAAQGSFRAAQEAGLGHAGTGWSGATAPTQGASMAMPSTTPLASGTAPMTMAGSAPTLASAAGPTTASGMSVGTAAPLFGAAETAGMGAAGAGATGALGAEALGAGMLGAEAAGLGAAGAGAAAGMAGAAGAAGATAAGTAATMLPEWLMLGLPFLCWVARAVYGVDNPKWRQFRDWLTLRAPLWFFALYVKHGERFAGWLENKPMAKWLVRKLFDAILAYDRRQSVPRTA